MIGPAPTSELAFERLSEDEMRARAAALLARLSTRRSVRHFSREAVPRDVVERCIEIASTAPSGANKQPWTFVLVSSPELKTRLRDAAEREERAFYGGRAPQRWLDDLAALGTDEHKPFLEDAPFVIAVFAQRHGASEDEKHYYVTESVGIACGFLIAALHECGLATLTHTPSPMGFLAEALGRPANERAYLLLPVGLPGPGCRVPALAKKPLDQVLVRR